MTFLFICLFGGMDEFLNSSVGVMALLFQLKKKTYQNAWAEKVKKKFKKKSFCRMCFFQPFGIKQCDLCIIFLICL